MSAPQYAREIGSRYRLEGVKCERCGAVCFPARRICPACKSAQLKQVPLAREGSIVAFTVIHVAPAAFALEAPYAMAIVQLDDGVRLTAPITDCELERLQVGTRVRAVFRRIGTEGAAGILRYGRKFVPCDPVRSSGG